MKNIDRMSDKFYVFKKSEVYRYLDGDQYEELLGIMDTVFGGLMRDNINTDREYLVFDMSEQCNSEGLGVDERILTLMQNQIMREALERISKPCLMDLNEELNHKRQLACETMKHVTRIDQLPSVGSKNAFFNMVKNIKLK